MVKDLVEEKGTTLYACPACRGNYSSLEEAAEKCASPRTPKYEVGQWILIRESLIVAVPDGDEDYENIPEDFVARISGISDENKVWGLNVHHPTPVYSFDKGETPSFDKGETPLTFYNLREKFLGEIDDSAIERLRKKHEEKQKEIKALIKTLDEVIDTLTKK